jgi:hypothetical protein
VGWSKRYNHKNAMLDSGTVLNHYNDFMQLAIDWQLRSGAVRYRASHWSTNRGERPRRAAIWSPSSSAPASPSAARYELARVNFANRRLSYGFQLIFARQGRAIKANLANCGNKGVVPMKVSLRDPADLPALRERVRLETNVKQRDRLRAVLPIGSDIARPIAARPVVYAARFESDVSSNCDRPFPHLAATGHTTRGLIFLNSCVFILRFYFDIGVSGS